MAGHKPVQLGAPSSGSCTEDLHAHGYAWSVCTHAFVVRRQVHFSMQSSKGALGELHVLADSTTVYAEIGVIGYQEAGCEEST